MAKTQEVTATEQEDALLQEVRSTLKPFEVLDNEKFCVFTDDRTGAHFCEVHVSADALIEHSTIDVPLDPDGQPDYRANRSLVEDAYAFRVMKEDAKAGRSFSNIVAEFIKKDGDQYPLKIIGGQHRIEAIREALGVGINKHHGVKIYLGLTTAQRLDVQLISNTNIEASSDLWDRMQETHKGPELRQWCQSVGLLGEGQDFADRALRGAVTVRLARTFILNYFKGSEIDSKHFDGLDTTSVLAITGQHDQEWEKLRGDRSSELWTHQQLQRAGQEFSRLVNAQRAAFARTRTKSPIDQPEKALSAAILAAWAYVAGILHKNENRLKRHYALADKTGGDPLNAKALAAAKHKTDPDTYRGLGTRTDVKDRGRLVELFYLQAEDGSGISKSSIDIAMAKYHAKQAQLDVLKMQARNRA